MLTTPSNSSSQLRLSKGIKRAETLDNSTSNNEVVLPLMRNATSTITLDDIIARARRKISGSELADDKFQLPPPIEIVSSLPESPIEKKLTSQHCVKFMEIYGILLNVLSTGKYNLSF